MSLYSIDMSCAQIAMKLSHVPVLIAIWIVHKYVKGKFSYYSGLNEIISFEFTYPDHLQLHKCKSEFQTAESLYWHAINARKFFPDLWQL